LSTQDVKLLLSLYAEPTPYSLLPLLSCFYPVKKPFLSLATLKTPSRKESQQPNNHFKG